MEPNIKRDYMEVFSSDPGQRVLDDLCSKFGLSASSFTQDDALQMAFREGMRNAALIILTMIDKPAIEIIRTKFKSSQTRNTHV